MESVDHTANTNAPNAHPSSGPCTPVKALRVEHERIEGLLSRVKGCQEFSLRLDLIHELFLELRVHSIAEAGIFYPRIEKLFQRKHINHAASDSYAMLALMLQLEDKRADAASFKQTLAKLEGKFADHKNESECLFAQIKDLESNPCQRDLAQAMQAQRTKLHGS